MTGIQFKAHRPRELVSQARSWIEQGYNIALLTLINIKGNAPYPVGSQMLVSESGEYAGQITGGCAEQALVDSAIRAMNSRTNLVERYGFGSKYFDIQLPCGSGIDVHFEVNLSAEKINSIDEKLQNRSSVDWEIICEEHRFLKRFFPNERLIVFGQGPIKPILINLARCSGFDVLSFDDAQAIDFENDGAPYCDKYSAIVSLFHEHEHEIRIFSKALAYDLFYFGALGSKRTHAARLASLQGQGLSDELCRKIHGPVGLDIGAVSPEQIAISILSEIIGVMSKGGRFVA